MKPRSLSLLSLAVFVILATGLASTAADQGQWPQWRGPNRDGVSTETGLLKSWPSGGPKLAWKADLGGVGYGSPVIANGKIFALAATDDAEGKGEYAVALDAATGKQVWKADMPASQGGYSQNWGSGPRSTPTVDGDVVYALGARGDLLALNAVKGTKIWGTNLVKDFGGKVPSWGYSESVLIDGNKLLCTPGGKQGAILALDKKTGKKLWQSAGLEDGAGYSSIIAADIAGVPQYITQTMQAAVGVNAKNGKPLWRVAELKRSTAVIPTPVVYKDHAFFTSGYGAGCELLKLESDSKGGTKATVVYTKNPVLANHHGGVIRVGERIYGYSDRLGWVCFDFMKGGEDAEWASKNLDKGSLTVADGNLYCYGQGKGTVVLADASPGGWKEKGRFEIPEKSKHPRRSGNIWSHPVVAGGKLFLRDHELLFAYDIAAK